MRTEQQIWTESFVEDGAVIVRELGFEGMLEPVPDEESAVAALVPGKTGRVFGLTAGRKSHFFVYDDFPQEDCVIPMGVVAENASGGHLVCTSQGLVYGVSCAKAAGGQEARTVMFRYDPAGTYIGSEYSFVRGKPEAVPCPFERREVLSLVIDRRRDLLFGLLAPDNVLFSHDPATGKFMELAGLGSGKVSKVLCLTRDGALYGAAEEGVVFRLAPGQARVEFTEMVLPCGKGKEYVNEASALAYDAKAEVIYGGTYVDGYLFKIELKGGRVICLGKPIDQRPIRCLAVGFDGTLYGIAGDRGTGICHLFRYRPETGDLRDLGVLRATVFKSWIAHEIDAMCTNRNGHIVMGENDRMSHLLIYFPPVGAAEDNT